MEFAILLTLKLLRFVFSILSTIVVLGYHATAFASTINLPQTGQTKCYDAMGTEIDCTTQGQTQDGAFRAGKAWPIARFTDNGDGTVTDNLTTMVWSKDADLMKSRDPEFTTNVDGTVTPERAFDYINKLNYENHLGYNDWRLPNINEIKSLTDIQMANPALPSSHLFNNVQSGVYCSSTASSYDAWVLNVASGAINNIQHYLDTYNYNNICYVWPVRGGEWFEGFDYSAIPKTGQSNCNYNYCLGKGLDSVLQKGIAWPEPRFVNNANGTVIDNLTDLIWTIDANAPGPAACSPAINKTWQESLDYVDCLNSNGYLGYTDWRLPNRLEFESLIENRKLPEYHPFLNVQSNLYWTSSTFTDSTDSAWYVDTYFSNGGSLGAAPKSSNMYVWPVRGGMLGDVYKPDTTAPVLKTFSTLATANNVTIPILSFTATDNVSISGWCVMESNNSADCAWSRSAPTSFTFNDIVEGVPTDKTLHAFVKDAAGNISVRTAMTTITADLTPPVISAFVIPTTSPTLAVPITTFTVTDNIGVVGYCLSETNDSSSCSWSGDAPTSFTFTGVVEVFPLSKTLYAFVKDAAENISTAFAMTNIPADNTAPVINSFTIPAASPTLAVPVTTFTASDNRGVAGYCLTETNDSSNCAWKEVAPSRFTFSAGGSRTLYAFVKDPAGNFSSSASATITFPIEAPVINLPKTGLNSCYDAAGTTIDCATQGQTQDGAIRAGKAWPDPRLVDNGNGTVSDELTYLVWAKNANLIKTRDPGFDSDNYWSGDSSDSSFGDGAVTFQHALDYIEKLNADNYLGYNDWRLPNANELKSLIDIKYSNPSLPYHHPFENVQTKGYWSSSPYPAVYNYSVWIASMGWGALSERGKTANYYVWPVRSKEVSGAFVNSAIPKTTQYDDFQTGVDWPSPRFSDNSDGTTRDNLTGLIWSTDADPQGPSPCVTTRVKNWQGALDHISCLNNNGFLGYTDWRLPNRAELESLIDYRMISLALPLPNPFYVIRRSYYWSSSTVESSTSRAWQINLSSGMIDVCDKSTISDYYGIWPVRGGLLDDAVIDSTPPLITSFTIPPNSSSLTIPVNLTATDNERVAYWCLSEVDSSSDCGWSATVPASYTFSNVPDVVAAQNTLYAWAKDAAGNVSTAATATITLSINGVCGSVHHSIVTIAPDANLCASGTPSAVTGSGPWTWSCRGKNGGTDANCMAYVLTYPLTLNFGGSGGGSVSGNIVCTSGSACQPTEVAINTQVALIPLANGTSTFTGWSGACTNTTGNCTLTMDGAKTVTATFTAAPRVKVGAKEFSTIQTAHNDAATVNNSVIKLLEGTLTENVIFGRNIGITLDGGYNAAFASASTETIIRGRMQLRAGTVRVKRVTVR